MRATGTGTHRGEYMSLPPTGKPITYNEIFIWRLAGGQITEMWGVVDVFAQLKRLGMTPAQRTLPGPLNRTDKGGESSCPKHGR